MAGQGADARRRAAVRQGRQVGSLRRGNAAAMDEVPPAAVDHGVVGAKIAELEGLPEAAVRIIKRHLGGGITAQEAEKFGWPKDVYTPVTLEEKIVSYADKLVDQSKRVPIDLEIERLQVEHRDAAERVRKLHEEITRLLGD